MNEVMVPTDSSPCNGTHVTVMIVEDDIRTTKPLSHWWVQSSEIASQEKDTRQVAWPSEVDGRHI